MHLKTLALIFCTLVFIVLTLELVCAITTISASSVYPGETISITINPNKKFGFRPVIPVMQNTTLVDAILVSCSDPCNTKQTINYVVPQSFEGQYYFATWDYQIADYEIDFFTVSQPPQQWQVYRPDITDFDSPNQHLLVNPIKGKNSSVIISSIINARKCGDYSLNAYLCSPNNYFNCNKNNYTYSAVLNYAYKVGSQDCMYEYRGNSTLQFWRKPGTWKLRIALSDNIFNETNFTYNMLATINYTDSIDFGELYMNKWVTARPLGGISLINFGNIGVNLTWQGENFNCTSPNCTGIWQISYPDPVFQIDDDSLFNETSETGVWPVYITNYSVSYFSPYPHLKTCISDSCNSSVGERFSTYYNMRIPELPFGNYEGKVQINILIP
ncbi:MAG: hypothetical protein ABIH72_02165 [archaeon]